LFSFVEVVEIYFLAKGHTHGQIDQMFSVFSRYLKVHPARTLPELCFGLRTSYNNEKKKKAKKQAEAGEGKKDLEVTNQVVDTVIDVVTWLESLEIKGARKRMGLQRSHAFQLQLGPMKDVVLVRSKEWAVSPEWLVSLIFIFVWFYICFFFI
jgi:hypothetical protein